MKAFKIRKVTVDPLWGYMGETYANNGYMSSLSLISNPYGFESIIKDDITVMASFNGKEAFVVASRDERPPLDLKQGECGIRSDTAEILVKQDSIKARSDKFISLTQEVEELSTQVKDMAGILVKAKEDINVQSDKKISIKANKVPQEMHIPYLEALQNFVESVIPTLNTLCAAYNTHIHSAPSTPPTVPLVPSLYTAPYKAYNTILNSGNGGGTN